MVAVLTSVATEVKRSGITPEMVLDTAMAIVESEGVDALTMRRLATDLGVRTPTVYWHVGSRQEIFDKLIERIAEDFARIEPKGATPAERITSVCMALIGEVRRRPHVIAVSRTAGRGEAIFTRSQQTIAREVEASGLRGHEAAFAIRTVLFQLGGFIMLDHGAAHDSSLHGVDRWELDAPEVRADLERSVDFDEVFRYSLDAVLAKLMT